MVLKLYGILPSPPVRAVLMCAEALGIELELVPVDLLGLEQLKEDFIKKNPQHTVPILEEEDGFTLTDSHAIMAYLVAQYGKEDSLYPKNNNRFRANIDHKLHLDSSILFNRGLVTSKPLVLYGVEPVQEKIEELKEAFQIVDRILEISDSKYIAGDALTVADFSIITSVTSWDVFVPYANYPNLKAYVERFEKLPYSEINKEGLAMYKKLVADALIKIKK